MKTWLVTFATSAFYAGQLRLAESATSVGGIDEVVTWNYERWSQQEFYRAHLEVTGRRRGAGFWIWKPFIILDLLRKVSAEDVVFYWDTGKIRGSRSSAVANQRPFVAPERR